MVPARWWLLLGPAILAVGLTPRAEAGPNEKKPAQVRLGILTGMFRGVPPVIIQTVAEPFRDIFKEHTGLSGGIDLVDDCETLAARMNAKELEFGVFHGFEYAWIKDRYPDLRPLVIAAPHGGTVQACLVVNSNSKAVGPADLKGGCVAVPAGIKAHCLLFHDRLRAGVSSGDCAATEDADLTPEEVLDAVANKKCAAAIVDGSSLTAYRKNKPGVAMRLKVLVRSEPFPPGVVVYRKGAVNPTMLSKVRDGLVTANKSPQGRAFMLLWKLNGFEEPGPEYTAMLERSLKAYPPPPLANANLVPAPRGPK